LISPTSTRNLSNSSFNLVFSSVVSLSTKAFCSRSSVNINREFPLWFKEGERTNQRDQKPLSQEAGTRYWFKWGLGKYFSLWKLSQLPQTI
jgi:hypothetical protein